VFDNRALRRMFEPEIDKIIGRKKLRNEELPNFYFPPNIIRIITSRRTRWVARMGANECM
jgi:hypothetical protein